MQLLVLPYANLISYPNHCSSLRCIGKSSMALNKADGKGEDQTLIRWIKVIQFYVQVASVR